VSNSKLSFLRTVLKPLGLSENAIDKTIEFISDLLFEKDETSSSKIEYSYYLCEEFITPAGDNFVNHVFEAANLPLVHFPVQRNYSQSELMSKLSTYISSAKTSNKESDETQISSLRCPKCGGEMVLRTAKHGDNQGENFWGKISSMSRHS
jgi:predicted RNA-binding Zn-ribbon protein involved in translation (DUF1610 family)